MSVPRSAGGAGDIPLSRELRADEVIDRVARVALGTGGPLDRLQGPPVAAGAVRSWCGERVDRVGAPLRAARDPLLEDRLLGGGQRLLRRHLVGRDLLPQLARVGLPGTTRLSRHRVLARQVELALRLGPGVAVEAPRRRAGRATSLSKSGGAAESAASARSDSMGELSTLLPLAASRATASRSPYLE